MEKKLKEKVDLLINRCDKQNPKKDVLLLIEGDEGEGKTNMSAGIGYYVSFITKRPLNNFNFFFDTKKMIEFAKSTEKQIVIWDEPALVGLSSEWWKETQRNLIKLLMMARKKQHFFIFNITRFDKFKDNIIERAIGMIRVYSRKQVEPGKFLYFKRKNLLGLFSDWKKTRKRFYNKYYNYHGTFPEVLGKVIDENEYDKAKDEAIMQIGGNEKESIYNKRLLLLQYRVSMLPKKTKAITQDWLCKELGTNRVTLFEWRKIPKKYPNIAEIIKET